MFKVSAIKLQLKSIRLQLRFLAPLLLTLVAAAYLAVPLMDQVTLRWFSRDLNMRGVLLANALSDSIGAALAEGRSARLGPLLQRTARDERLFAIGLCSPQGRLVQQTERYPESLSCARAAEVAREAEPRFELAGGPVHVGLHPVYASPSTAPAAAAEQAIELPAEQASVRAADREAAEGRARQAARAASAAAGATAAEGAEPAVLGQLVLLHDLSFIERRSQDTRRYLIGLIAALGLIIALITVVVAQVSWNGWVRGVRAIMRGEG
ncbi:MAG: hypothetical protein U1F25_21020, partial [Rubrivivax sp.]